MLAYLDPKHPYRALKEARRIIDAADTDGDGSIKLDEFIKEYQEKLAISWQCQ